jgi:hypothetical protein
VSQSSQNFRASHCSYGLLFSGFLFSLAFIRAPTTSGDLLMAFPSFGKPLVYITVIRLHIYSDAHLRQVPSGPGAQCRQKSAQCPLMTNVPQKNRPTPYPFKPTPAALGAARGIVQLHALALGFLRRGLF